MSDRLAATSVPIHELLARRWSPRAFDASRAPSAEQVTALLEAARWAPSCNGDEPWRFIVCDRARDADGWQRLYDCLSEGNRKWVGNVPLLILACADSRFSFNGKPNRWAQHDTGMAAMSIVLQAVALGLAAHQMGGYDAEKARAAFAIPAEFTPMSVIAVGYQADPSVLDEETRAKEVKPRSRKPLAEKVFRGAWGRA